MDAQRVILPGWLTPQRIVAILVFIVGTWCSPIFANTVHTYGGDFNLPLLDPIGSGSEMTEAAIAVLDHFIIADLDVRIDITHTRVFDLQLILQSPCGTRVCLNKYEFKEIFEGENYTDTTFDDEAELAIEEGTAPFTGHFRPEIGYLLASFNGQDAFGAWRLEIYDWWPVDTGKLNSFELIFTEIPEPASALLMTFVATILTLHRKKR